MKTALRRVWYRLVLRYGKRGAILLTSIPLAMIIGGGGTYAALNLGSGGQGSINLQQGLVGHWKLDGNAVDSSPNNNHGTINEAVATTDRQDKSDSAYNFDGDNDNIQIPGDPSIESWPDGVTVSVWAKSDTSTWNSTGFLVSKRNSFIIHPSSGTKGVTFYIYDGGWKSVSKTVSGDLTDWHLYTATYDNSTLKLYIDGSTPATNSIAGTIDDDTGGMFFGHDDGISGRYLDGQLDDVRIYNRALSGDEVSALYSQYDAKLSVASGEKGLIGRWRFDGNVKDSTPQGNNGTVSGTSYTTDRRGGTDKAITFNGTTDYVYAKIGDGTYFGQNNPLSASAWVYVTSSSSGPVFGVTSAPPGGSWNMPFLSLNGTTVYGHLWQVNGNTPLSHTVSANAWHHIAVTYSPGSTPSEIFYVDGQPVATASGTYSPSGATDYFTTYISGSKPAGVSSYLNTPIDDVRAYNRVLSPDEVANIYNSYDAQINLYGGGGSSASSTGAGLVGRWMFSGNAKDDTPYGNNGTVNGATLTTNRYGYSNSAYNFISASSNYIGLSTMNIPSSISVSAWVYSTNFNQNGFIVGKNPVNNQWELFFEGSVLRWRGGSTTSVACSNPSNSSWHHVVGTQTGTTATVYIDGVQCNTGAVTAINNGTDTVEIGRFRGGYYFNGKIDDVRIYNRALTAEEVQSLYY